MTAVTMSKPMEAGLRSAAARACEVTKAAFDAAMTQTMTQPMPTLNEAINFKVTTPADGTRGFQFTVSLSEVSNASTLTATTGWNL